MSNTADQQVFQELEAETGAWTSALGGANPSQALIAQWNKDAGGNQMTVEASNVGWWAQQHNLTANRADVTAKAQADPRWAQLDATGQAALLEMYNVQAMGYGGTLSQNVPLPVQTPGPTGDINIGSPAPGGLTSGQTDAWTQLQQTLQSYGFTGTDLTNLVAWAKGEVISGSSAAQITLDLQQTPEFQTRFPAIGELAKNGVAITPAQYIQLEDQYANLEQQAGLPPNFATYDQLIAKQVSPAEYSARINQGYLAVSTAPPETIKAMQDYYGVTPGQLAAYFLNPTQQEPILLQQALSAQIGGASAKSGFGEVSQGNAMQLAQMGTTYAQAQSGFQTLAGQQQLYSQLPGQGNRISLTPEQLLQEQFGSDAQTKTQLAIQAQQEKNFFSQGTGVASTNAGLQGAGTVQR